MLARPCGRHIESAPGDPGGDDHGAGLDLRAVRRPHDPGVAPGGPEDRSLGERGAIFKVNPWTGHTRLWAEDILSPTGIAVSDHGDVYAASMFGNEIVEIDAWTRESSQFLAVDGPAAVELSGDTLYATAGFSFGQPTGTVIKADIK